MPDITQDLLDEWFSVFYITFYTQTHRGTRKHSHTFVGTGLKHNFLKQSFLMPDKCWYFLFYVLWSCWSQMTKLILWPIDQWQPAVFIKGLRARDNSFLCINSYILFSFNKPFHCLLSLISSTGQDYLLNGSWLLMTQLKAWRCK